MHIAALEVDEIGRSGRAVVAPSRRGHDHRHLLARQLAQAPRALFARILGDGQHPNPGGKLGGPPARAQVIPEAPADRAAAREEREQRRRRLGAESHLDGVAPERGANHVVTRVHARPLARLGQGGIESRLPICARPRALQTPEDFGVAAEQADHQHHQQHQHERLARDQDRHRVTPLRPRGPAARSASGSPRSARRRCRRRPATSCS